MKKIAVLGMLVSVMLASTAVCVAGPIGPGMIKFKGIPNIPLVELSGDPAFPANDSVIALRFKIDLGTIDYSKALPMAEVGPDFSTALNGCAIEGKTVPQTKTNAAAGARIYLVFKNTAGNPANWLCFKNLSQISFIINTVMVAYPDNSVATLPVVSPAPGSHTYTVGPVQPK